MVASVLHLLALLIVAAVEVAVLVKLVELELLLTVEMAATEAHLQLLGHL
jgi:hypothetical protein